MQITSHLHHHYTYYVYDLVKVLCLNCHFDMMNIYRRKRKYDPFPDKHTFNFNLTHDNLLIIFLPLISIGDDILIMNKKLIKNVHNIVYKYIISCCCSKFDNKK